MVKKGHQLVFLFRQTGTYWENFSDCFFFVLFQNHFLFHFLTKDFIN